MADVKKKRNTVSHVIKGEPCFKSTEKSGFEIHTIKNEVQFAQLCRLIVTKFGKLNLK